jgi:hypothetical protein
VVEWIIGRRIPFSALRQVDEVGEERPGRRSVGAIGGVGRVAGDVAGEVVPLPEFSDDAG